MQLQHLLPDAETLLVFSENEILFAWVRRLEGFRKEQLSRKQGENLGKFYRQGQKIARNICLVAIFLGKLKMKLKSFNQENLFTGQNANLYFILFILAILFYLYLFYYMVFSGCAILERKRGNFDHDVLSFSPVCAKNDF